MDELCGQMRLQPYYIRQYPPPREQKRQEQRKMMLIRKTAMFDFEYIVNLKTFQIILCSIMGHGRQIKTILMALLQISKAWEKIFNTKIIMQEPTYTFTWQWHPTMSIRRLFISVIITSNTVIRKCVLNPWKLLISFFFSLHHPRYLL